MSDEKTMAALRAEAALDSTYARGLRLARSGGVLLTSKSAGSVGSTVGLSGRVRGSGGAYYSVTVDLDTSEHEVLDYSCTCPAASSYRGMCKHEIALALAFLGERSMPSEGPVPGAAPLVDGCGRSGSPDAPRMPAGSGSYGASGVRRELPTSPGMEALLARAARVRLGQATESRPQAPGTRQPARLIPRSAWGRGAARRASRSSWTSAEAGPATP